MRDDDLNGELEALTRRMLVEQVRAHPDRTLTELFEVVLTTKIGRQLGKITIGELLDDTAPLNGRKVETRAEPGPEFKTLEPSAPAPSDMSGIPEKPNRSLRAPEQLDEFDGMVLRLLQMFEPASPIEISRIVSEPIAVTSAALERLCERGEATTRAGRYKAKLK